MCNVQWQQQLLDDAGLPYLICQTKARGCKAVTETSVSSMAPVYVTC